MSKKTVVFGATDNPSRYAYMAAQQLLAHGHQVVLMSIRSGALFGHQFLLMNEKPAIEDVDTITLYVGVANLDPWIEYLLTLHPKRIIFNPGTENRHLVERARLKGIEVELACTLVMLRTGQY